MKLFDSGLLACPGRSLLNILAAFSTFLVFYIYIINYDSTFSLNTAQKLKNQQDAKSKTNSTNKKLGKIANFSDLKVEFHQLNANFCNVLALDQPDCLQKLVEFDKNMIEKLSVDKLEDFDENQRRFCEYLPNGKTIDPFLHHTFFHYELNDTESRRMMQLNIMSFLATQNLQCTKLIVWILKDFSHELINIFKTKFGLYVKQKTLELRVFDLKEMCGYRETSKGRFYSSFEEHAICKSQEALQDVLSRKNQIALSDFLRFVVLDVFGGIYVDGDVIFFKDTRILWNENFAYRWSYVEYYNTAVLGLNKYKNPSTKLIYDSVMTQPGGVDNFIDIFFPERFFQHVASVSKGGNFQFDTMTSYHR
jgi:hypothetical protein